MIKDDLCPTCGSKNFESVTSSELNANKKQCRNCKKFWFE